MKKTKTLNLIQILSVLLLICLCVSGIGVANSWFTTSGKNVLVEVYIGAINLKVMQGETEINTNKSEYIDISGEILPDEAKALNLTLKNGETASDGYYIRYKIEFCVGSIDGNDVVLDGVEISGYNQQTDSEAGFKQETDGWLYYKNASGQNDKYQAGLNLSIIGAFTIPYEEFVDEDGNSILNCSNLKIKIYVEGSVTGEFTEEGENG